MQLLSVNTGALQLLPEGKTRTGICKLPVLDSVLVGELGLAGDKIGNKKHHGGPDQAVYLYSAEDYAWWENTLGRPLPPGIFGENFTVSTFGPEPTRVGDIYHVGPEVVLQLTAPRIPCSKLAQRMGDPGFVKTFASVNRGGSYARVLRAGEVRAGLSIRVEAAPVTSPSIDELFEVWHLRDKDPALLRRALEAPVAERVRVAFEGWLAR